MRRLNMLIVITAMAFVAAGSARGSTSPAQLQLDSPAVVASGLSFLPAVKDDESLSKAILSATPSSTVDPLFVVASAQNGKEDDKTDKNPPPPPPPPLETPIVGPDGPDGPDGVVDVGIDEVDAGIAIGETTIETLDELFEISESVTPVGGVTVAVFIIVVVAVVVPTLAVSQKVSLALEGKNPVTHCPELVSYVSPLDELAATKLKPTGSISWTTAPVPLAGPKFETTSM